MWQLVPIFRPSPIPGPDHYKYILDVNCKRHENSGIKDLENVDLIDPTNNFPPVTLGRSLI